MDKIDKSIINHIQSDFPISRMPYKDIADTLGLEEDLVLERIKLLKKNDIIRRIGGNFHPEKLGFHSTLCAACVPDERIEEFTKTVNSYKGVTHNYIRKNKFNIWFTFIASSTLEIEKSLEEIRKKTGIKKILNLPATDVFKIRAKFKV